MLVFFEEIDHFPEIAIIMQSSVLENVNRWNYKTRNPISGKVETIYEKLFQLMRVMYVLYNVFCKYKDILNHQLKSDTTESTV